MTKKFLFLSALVLMLTSCGGSLEDIIGEGDNSSGGAVTPSGGGSTTVDDVIKYGFKLTSLAGVDLTGDATSLKMIKTDGTVVAEAEMSAGKITIKNTDLTAAAITTATDFWFEATVGTDNYVAKVNIDPATLSPETDKTLAMATVGDVIKADGKFYVAGTADAAAKICYLGSETGDVDYKHGLALALSDENPTDATWATAKSTCEGKTPTVANASPWMMPSKDQWEKMIKASGGYAALRVGFTSVGGTNMELYNYWSSTGNSDSKYAFDFGGGTWDEYTPNPAAEAAKNTRACLAF